MEQSNSGKAIFIVVIGFIIGVALFEAGWPFLAFIVFILAVALAFAA